MSLLLEVWSGSNFQKIVWSANKKIPWNMEYQLLRFMLGRFFAMVGSGCQFMSGLFSDHFRLHFASFYYSYTFKLSRCCSMDNLALCAYILQPGAVWGLWSCLYHFWLVLTNFEILVIHWLSLSWVISISNHVLPTISQYQFDCCSLQITGMNLK